MTAPGPDAAGPGAATLAIWPQLLALARRRRAATPECRHASPGGGEDVSRDGIGSGPMRPASPAERAAMDLYLPVAAPDRQCFVIGHLGQSVDGHIATENGDSRYVNGAENLAHLHRLRALSDAVVVGPGTAARDDPRLTVRHVAGDNPVRVVLDPGASLPQGLRMFTDGAAPTLRIGASAPTTAPGAARPVTVPVRDGRLDLAATLAALRARGLRVVFVEGGGRTVSAFLEAGLLDRLHIAAAPVLMGAGRRGVQLPPAATMAACSRPPYRVFRMGGDLLWDFDLRAPGPVEPTSPGLARIL